MKSAFFCSVARASSVRSELSSPKNTSASGFFAFSSSSVMRAKISSSVGTRVSGAGVGRGRRRRGRRRRRVGPTGGGGGGAGAAEAASCRTPPGPSPGTAKSSTAADAIGTSRETPARRAGPLDRSPSPADPETIHAAPDGARCAISASPLRHHHAGVAHRGLEHAASPSARRSPCRGSPAPTCSAGTKVRLVAITSRPPDAASASAGTIASIVNASRGVTRTTSRAPAVIVTIGASVEGLQGGFEDEA